MTPSLMIQGDGREAPHRNETSVLRFARLRFLVPLRETGREASPRHATSVLALRRLRLLVPLRGTGTGTNNLLLYDLSFLRTSLDPALGTRGQASFVVGKGTPGLTQGKKESKLGIRASHTAEIVLEDCSIPAENLLGGEEKLEKKLQRGREGKKSRGADALATFEVTRPLVGASALGIAQAAYEWTLEYLEDKQEDGVPLMEQQRIQQTLADVATEAKVSAATLVQRFGSKRGLLLALFSTSPGGVADEYTRIRQNSKSALAAVYAEFGLDPR